MKIKYNSNNYIQIDKQEHLDFYKFYIDEIILNKIYNYIPNEMKLMIVLDEEYKYLVSIAWNLNSGYMPIWIITLNNPDLDIKDKTNIKYLGMYKRKS